MGNGFDKNGYWALWVTLKFMPLENSLALLCVMEDCQIALNLKLLLSSPIFINVLAPRAATPLAAAGTPVIAFVRWPRSQKVDGVPAETLPGVLETKVSVSTAEVSAPATGVATQVHVSLIS